MPVEPEPSTWRFPDPRGSDDDLVAIGADLSPGTLLAAYRAGLFPMPGEPLRGVRGRRPEPPYWFSPVRRGVLPLRGLKVSRSLRRSCRDLEIRIDTAFDRVVTECADPRRPLGWINQDIARAYGELHRLGWAHSVETWRDGELVGGLYGVAIGGLFAGESMFHRVRDASKVALVALVDLLDDEWVERRVLDVQWRTEHLASLGVIEVPREEYLLQMAQALRLPLPECWRG